MQCDFYNEIVHLFQPFKPLYNTTFLKNIYIFGGNPLLDLILHYFS